MAAWCRLLLLHRGGLSLRDPLQLLLHHWTPHTCLLHHNRLEHRTVFCTFLHVIYCSEAADLSFNSFTFFFSFSSSLLGSARLSLIRMMDGAELWLQPSPAASWELGDTEGEVKGCAFGGGGVCACVWVGLVKEVALAAHTVGLPNKTIPRRVCHSACFQITIVGTFTTKQSSVYDYQPEFSSCTVSGNSLDTVNHSVW